MVRCVCADRKRGPVKRLLLTLAIAGLLSGQSAVPVAQYNNLRTNANLEESVLNTSNVNVNQFGKLFTRTLDGYSYAHPLYVPNVSVPGQGIRNVVYVATLHNTVYAFDADDPAQSTPYWSVNLGSSLPFPAATLGGYVQPEMGIMSTPAIDLTTGTMYVVATVQQGVNAAMYLHALDLATGTPKFGSPAMIQAQVSGSLTAPDRNPDGTITWNPNTRMQRSALLVANGNVYLGFSSYGTYYQYHGWVMAYNASNVQQQVAVFNTSLNGLGGGIWQSGAGFAEDAQGSVYLMSANGPYTGTTDFGDSFIRFGPQLQVLDWFTPSNWYSLFQNDLDLGSGGPSLVPNSNLLVGAGKQGVIYLVDSTNMGHLETGGSHPVQAFQATPACTGPTQCTEVHSTALWSVSPYPCFYIWGWNDVLRGFRLIGGQFETTPFSQSSITSAYPGGTITVSSLGDAAGTGIVWAATAQSSSLVNVVPGTLRAFDAMDLSHELWNSDMNTGRDAMGNLAKFEGPVVANGRVYVPTFSNQLVVYGLLSGAGSLSGSANSSSTAVSLTAEGNLDWVHWGESSLNRKAGGAAQIGQVTIVDGGNPTNYSNDPRLVNWTDGTPTASSTNNKNGIYISGIGHGFTFTAPADTTTRTLIVHVGGWNSSGALTAHLSNGAVSDFTNATSNASGQYDRNYTLVYNAGVVGQSLTVTWKMTAGSGNVTLNGAALSSAAPVMAPNISATGGTPETTAINTSFATALQAAVKDASSNPISGAAVTFTAPGSGASGAFGGLTTVIANTDVNGLATAPPFEANAIAGNYTVVASTPSATGSASFNLTNQVGPAASVTATGGAWQSATINTAFPNLMIATVKDSGGNLVSGVTVTFNAPVSGAGGTFDGGLTKVDVVTIANGTATAPAFTANGTAGGYGVTASVTGVATPAGYTMTNNPVAINGALSGSGDSARTAVDLSAEGALDWVHWGDTSLNRKSGGGSQIGTYTVVGGGSPAKYSNDPRPMSWTGGTLAATGMNNLNGLYLSGTGKGFTITAPADTTTRTLVVHVGGWNSGGTLTAHLSDGSSADFVNTTSILSGQYDRNYTLVYHAAGVGKVLTVTWKMASGSGNVTLNGAALQ
jgi:hypothetical protein